MAKRVTGFSVNWGRHENATEFRRNVLNVLDAGGDDAILGIQELDEADAPGEHSILRQALDGTEHLVGWSTFEPLVVPEHLRVRRSEVIPMCRGLARFTPARFLIEALVMDPTRPEVPPVVWMNQHPPRNAAALMTRRAQCRAVHRQRVAYWNSRGYSIVWMGDMNDPDYPQMHRNEQTAIHHGLDYIRYIPCRGGAQMEVVQTGSLNGTIDNHDPIWARFALSKP